MNTLPARLVASSLRRLPLLFILATLARLSVHPAGAAAPTFSAPVPGRVPDPVFTTVVGPAIADFDGDSYLDFAVTDAAGGSIFFSFGNADGTAKGIATRTGPTNPLAILAADLNGDSKMDLLIATETALTYFLNDGGTPSPFSGAGVNAALGIRAVNVAVADFNQDGYPDIIVSGDGDDGAGHTVGKLEVFASKVMSNAFDGYDPGLRYPAGATAARIAVGDLNGDGYPDVALARTAPNEGHGDVSVYFGNPSAVSIPTNFLNSPNSTVALTHYPLSIVIGDITQDGKADILTTAYVRPTGGGPLVLSFVELVRNLGNNGLAPGFSAGEFFFFDYATSGNVPPSDVKIADVDGDGVADIAAIDQEGVSLHVLNVSPVFDENSAYESLHLDAKNTFALNTGPSQLGFANLNADTFPDVVIAHALQGGVTTLLNTTPLTAQGPVAKAIQFDVGAYTANEGFPAPVDVIVKRANDSTGAVTLKFTVGGTATPNGSPKSDFALADPQPDKPPLKPTQNTATLMFAPGEFEKHITLFISQDPGSEPDETIILALQTPTGDAVLGSPRVATVTIKDSEPPALRGGNRLTAKPEQPISPTRVDKALKVKNVGRTPQPWVFTTGDTRNAKVAGLALKVQYSLTAPPNAVWVDLVDGGMSRPGNKGTKWTVKTTSIPDAAEIYFRSVSSAPNLESGFSAAYGPCRAVGSPLMKVTVKAEPASDPVNNSRTYPEESMSYRLSYKNVGLAVANHVVVGMQIPSNTRSDSGTGSPDIQLLPAGSASNAVAAYFDLGTVPVGDAGTRVVNVVVRPDLLALPPKNKKDPQPEVFVGLADSSKKIFTGIDSFAARESTPEENEDEGKRRLAGGPPLAFYGAFWDDPVPSSKPKPLYSGGPEVTTPVLQPIRITCVADKSLVELDETITYTVMLHNDSASDMQNVIYRNTAPPGTTFESAHDADGNGNFNQLPVRTDVNLTPTTNPGVTPFSFDGGPRTLTWTLPTLPAGAIREIKFTVRMLFDTKTDYTDSEGVLHPAEILNTFFELSAIRPSGRSFDVVSFQAGDTPFRTLVSARLADQQPQLRLEKEVEGTGKGRGQLRGEKDPGNKSAANPEGLIPSDVETVLKGDDLRYTVHFENTGDQGQPTVSTAVNCIIQEELAEDVIFNGDIKILNLVSVNLPDPRFVLRDKKGVVLPYPGHSITQDFKSVRIIEYRLGNVTPNLASDFSYRATPTVGVGKFVYSGNARIWTRSLSLPKSLKQQVVAKVVEPITFDALVTRNVSDPVPEGSLVTYTATIRNNGGIQASNVEAVIPIPEFTTYQAGTAANKNAQVPASVQEIKNAKGRTTALKFTFPIIDQQATPDPMNPNLPDTGRVCFTVTVDSPFPVQPGSLEGLFNVKISEIKGRYASGDVALLSKFTRARSLLAASTADSKVSVIRDDEGTFALSTRVRIGPQGPNLWAFKQYPLYVVSGQKMIYTICCGNSGTQTVPNARLGIFIPDHTTLDKTYTTPGYDDPKGKIGQPFDKVFWKIGDLPPHSVVTYFVVLNVLPGAVFERDLIPENSCAVDSDAYILDSKSGKLINMNIVPGPARTTVISDHPVVGTWQVFCNILQAVGANLFGQRNAQVQSDVSQFNNGSIGTTLRGADAIVLENGVVIIQNGGRQIVAAGGGNLVGQDGASIVAAGGGNLVGQDGASIVAAGGGNLVGQDGASIVAAGGGNLVGQDGASIVAAGGGNIVAAGGGNITSVKGIGLCTQANVLAKIQSIVAGGGGNIVAAGGGNLVRIDNGVATLVGQDGASLRDNSNAVITIDRLSPGVIDAGGGTSIAAGLGNVLAAGTLNLEAPLLAGSKGAAVIVHGNGIGLFTALGKSAKPLAQVVANDGAGIIGKGGAGLITDKGAGFLDASKINLKNINTIIGEHGAGIVGEHGAGIVGEHGSGFVGLSDPGLLPVQQ